MTNSDLPHALERIHLGGVNVVLATVTSAEAATQAARQLAVESGDRRYIGFVSADVGDELQAVLVALAPILAEIICFDPGFEGLTGAELAMPTLTDYGFGQDLVYTVADLSDAIDYAWQELHVHSGNWDGDALLVLGPAQVTGRARLHVAPPEGPPLPSPKAGG